MQRRRTAGTRAERLLYRATRPLPLLILVAAIAAAMLVGGGGAAYPAPPPPPPGSDQINTVIDNIRLWLMAIIGSIATLLAAVAGIRYMTANGDPGELAKAKETWQSAVKGYALAALAPLLVIIVGGWLT